MLFKNKLIIALASTVVVLVGGGALYLKIRSNPNKESVTFQTNSTQEQTSAQKEEDTTGAEKSAERAMKDFFAGRSIIYRDLVVKEAENDGYVALVFAESELRNDDGSWNKYIAPLEPKLVGSSWQCCSENKIFQQITGVESLQAWRDVQILDIDEVRLQPPYHGTAVDKCAPDGSTTTAIATTEIENKSDKERELDVRIVIDAIDLVKHGTGGCGEYKPLDGTQTFKLQPNSKETYNIIAERTEGGCCVYSQARLGKYDNLSDIIQKIDGFESPDAWWLEHLEYIP